MNLVSVLISNLCYICLNLSLFFEYLLEIFNLGLFEFLLEIFKFDFNFDSCLFFMFIDFIIINF